MRIALPAGVSPWDAAVLLMLGILGILYIAGSRVLAARGAHVAGGSRCSSGRGGWRS